MARFIAFLRAINVGGRTVKMETLAALFRGLEFQDVQTFIASGNVIFTSSCEERRQLEQMIEAHLQTSLGFEVKTFVRTGAEVAAIARYRPFTAAQLKTAVALNVALLSEPLSPEGEKALMTLQTEVDDFHAHEREVYWLCRRKQSESKFSNALFERRLQVRATFRGLNTIAKLADRCGSFSV